MPKETRAAASKKTSRKTQPRTSKIEIADSDKATARRSPKTKSSSHQESVFSPETAVSSAAADFSGPSGPVSRDDRDRMVQYAAYHIAERDGFQSGKEQDYWLQAEKQIDDLLRAKPAAKTSDIH